MRGSDEANPFCVTLAETEPGCRMCAEMQEHPAGAGDPIHTADCPAGLTDSVVPVRVGGKVRSYLQTGQVALRQLTRADFRRVADFLKEGGADVDWATLERACFGSRVISRKQYEAVVRLLEVFAQHLAIAAEQIATQQAHSESPTGFRRKVLRAP
jgi:hypothetical protein